MSLDATGGPALAAQAVYWDVHARRMAFKHAQGLLAKQLAPDFSPFDVYRNYEIDISRHLRLLLDPRGSHGQQHLFWNAFAHAVDTAHQAWLKSQSNLPEATTSAPSPLRWLPNAQVLQLVCEQKTQEGRSIDVYARLSTGLLGIENKPWQHSKDQTNQLQDYALYMEQQAAGRDWLLVYLAHDLPSEDSVCGDRRAQLQQQGHLVVLHWWQLMECLQQTLPHIQAPKVRLFVEDLCAMLKKSSGCMTDTAEMEYIAPAFTQSPQHLASAFAMRDVFRQWQVQQLHVLREQFAQRCKAEGIPLKWEVREHAPRAADCLTLLWPGTLKVGLRVGWDALLDHPSGAYWGLWVSGFQTQQPDLRWKHALQHCAAGLPSSPNQEDDWPMWWRLEHDPWFTPAEHEDSSIHPWFSMQRTDGTDFVSLILKRYHQLREALAHVPVQEWWAPQ